MYEKYHKSGLEILGFPCNQFGGQEPGSNAEIKQFANDRGATFTMFSKIEVNGSGTHPLWVFLKKQASGFITNDIKWNFTKFLVNREGKVLHRYASTTGPLSMESGITKLL